MKIGAPRELFEGECRVALTPDSAAQLQKLGYDCVIESGAGVGARYSDDAYREAGIGGAICPVGGASTHAGAGGAEGKHVGHITVVEVVKDDLGVDFRPHEEPDQGSEKYTYCSCFHRFYEVK